MGETGNFLPAGNINVKTDLSKPVNGALPGNGTESVLIPSEKF